MSSELIHIPRHLNDPPRLLFWPIDEAAVLLAPIMLLSIAQGRVLSGLLSGAILLWGVKRLKSGRGQRYLMSLLYWYFPLQQRTLKSVPASYVREYLG